MKPKYIVHIDYGSRGISGSYIERILQATSAEKNIRAYVHSEFIASRSKAMIIKIFDRWSSTIKNPKLKSVVKFIDIYLCFLKILLDVKALSKIYDVQLYCAFFQSFHVYSWFFKRVNKYCYLNVTVHDAVELEHQYPAFVMSDRNSSISHAHRLIVHGDESIQLLKSLGIPLVKIKFPVSHRKTEIYDVGGETVRFLFLGHIRPEKGVEILIDAWSSIGDYWRKRAELTIAGSDPGHIAKRAMAIDSCKVRSGYISDVEFESLIAGTHYVVLPYTGGTNSGILAEASSLLKPAITSRISCFSQNAFFTEALSFDSPQDLPKLIKYVVANHANKYPELVSRLSKRIFEYQKEFDSDIIKLYDHEVRS